MGRIIALVGPKGCGKSTAARALEKHGFKRTRIAEPVKAMLRTLGLSHAQVDGDAKEVPSEVLCGKTARWAMQSLGTEWGRDLIHQDLWLNAWVRAISDGVDVSVDDCRFPNELERIRELGGIVVRVVRAGFGHSSTHESEAHVLEADVEVENDGTPEELANKIMHRMRVEDYTDYKVLSSAKGHYRSFYLALVRAYVVSSGEVEVFPVQRVEEGCKRAIGLRVRASNTTDEILFHFDGDHSLVDIEIVPRGENT